MALGASGRPPLNATGVYIWSPQWLQTYLKLDVESFAHDLEISGDIVSEESDAGGVWIWSGH